MARKATARASRVNTSREAQARPVIGGEVERLRLDINISKLPRDLEATWVREEVAGKYDSENVQRAMEERGFQPATYDELNLPKPPVLPGREQETHGLIRRGGSILMVRPRADATMERRAQQKVNEDILRDTQASKEFRSKARDTGAEVPEELNRVTVKSSRSDRFEN